MGLPTTTPTVEVKKASNLFRRLSNVLLVNSSAFATATPTIQTAILTENSGLPVLFVSDFRSLMDKRAIRDKLLRGDDVSRELEFNGIELSSEELRVLSLVTPVLEKISGIGPRYDWLPEEDFSDTITFIKNGTDSSIQRSGYSISQGHAYGVWKRASAFWSGGKQPLSHVVITDGGYDYASKTTSYKPNSINIGCQSISRAEVEFIARHFNWKPNVE